MSIVKSESRCLVTGGAGVIGSNLTTTLLNHGHEVVVVDDLSSGDKGHIDPRCIFVNDSILNRPVLHDLFEKHKFTHVFHLAAFFANQKSVAFPEKDLNVNCQGIINLIEEVVQSKKHGRFRQLIYTSSSAIYGKVSGKIVEQRLPAPQTPYAVSKLAGEHYLSCYHQLYNIPFTCFRLFNCYGPGEFPGPFRNVIPNFIHAALKGEPLPLTGEGQETRDFTFIDDVMKGLLLSMDNEKSFSKIYNLASGKATKIVDLANMIIELSGSSSKLVKRNRRDWDDIPHRCGSIDLIIDDLGYKPDSDLKTGLMHTIEWMRQQTNKT